MKDEDWKPYPNDREILKRDGYVVIVPKDYFLNSERMPIFCSVCGFTFKSARDERTYKIFECCESCADTWAYSHKKEWQEGWRPSKEQVDLVLQKRIFAINDISFE